MCAFDVLSEKLQYIQYWKGTIIYFPVYHEIQDEIDVQGTYPHSHIVSLIWRR